MRTGIHFARKGYSPAKMANTRHAEPPRDHVSEIAWRLGGGTGTTIWLTRRDSLVRRQARAGLRLDFSRHHALGSRPEPDQHILAGTQFGHAEAAQCFHVDKNVRSALAAGQEA